MCQMKQKASDHSVRLSKVMGGKNRTGLSKIFVLVTRMYNLHYMELERVRLESFSEFWNLRKCFILFHKKNHDIFSIEKSFFFFLIKSNQEKIISFETVQWLKLERKSLDW